MYDFIMRLFFIFVFLINFSKPLLAEGGDGSFEVGPNFGLYLPSGLAEIDEVVKNFGVHGAIPLFGKGHLFMQFEFGRGDRSTITGFLVDFRTAVSTADDFTPYFMAGPHLFYARGTDATTGATGNYFRLGFNLGGGFMAKITDKIFFDFMIRLNAAPGTMMYIGSGFNFLL